MANSNYSKKRIKKKAKKEVEEVVVRSFKKAPLVTALVIFLVLAIIVGVCFYLYSVKNPTFMSLYHKIFGGSEYSFTEEDDVGQHKIVQVEGDLSIHFLTLGNEYTGDCVYIKAGNNDILVDAGSRANSVPTIQSYLSNYMTDNVLEYVIVTHADQDHIAGFAANNGLFSIYECQTIIDFAKSNKKLTTDNGGKTLYAKYLENRDEEVSQGANHYTAKECIAQENGAKKEFQLTTDIKFTILDQRFYRDYSADENNYSVCFLLTHGSRNFLFTGDLEADGETSLVALNTLPQVELFKAGHHGSKTSSNDNLLSVIKPKIVCVCCCAGSTEYTQNIDSMFPTQEFVNRVAKYTDKVYVTSRIVIKYDEEKKKYVNVGEVKPMNGNIVVMSTDTEVKVDCSFNNLKLKETKWFKNKRTCPSNWQVA